MMGIPYLDKREEGLMQPLLAVDKLLDDIIEHLQGDEQVDQKKLEAGTAALERGFGLLVKAITQKGMVLVSVPSCSSRCSDACDACDTNDEAERD